MIAGETSRAALLAAGERPLLYDMHGGVRTGSMLLDRVERLTATIASRKLTKRKIGLWYWNSFAAIEAFLAVEWLGATRVPVDPGATPEEAKGIFDAVGVDTILTDNEHATQLERDILLHDDEIVLEKSPGFVEFEVSPEATLHLYPRMVSRGKLLAVPISYGNWNAIMRVNESLYRTGGYGHNFNEQEECFLTVQQVMHGTGLLGTFPFILMGIPQVLIDRFDSEQVLEAMIRHGVTTTFFVPGMLTRLVDLLDKMSEVPPLSLRRVLYGGATLALDDMRGALRTLGPVLVQVYGRLEAGWPITVLDIEDHQSILGGNDELGTSCGKRICEVEVRLRPVDSLPNDEGELCVRSDMVVSEYADPDGWCSLGDIGRIDELGHVYLLGRLDNMINTGSYHVYPSEIEETILDVQGVREVMVVGEPDPVWGEKITAYIVPSDIETGEDISKRVRASIGKRLAKYKIPKVFHVVDRLPLSEK